LGALPGINSSVSYGINNNGLVVGESETGSVDPLTGYPEYHAVVWGQGGIKDLGTLGGSSSQAFAVNDWGQVVGVAANSVPDQYSGGIGPCTGWNCWTVTTQQRAFLWEGGNLQDLGTLGGDDALAYFLNQRGQVAGVSYTNTAPNPTTGNPTQDPFLWENGKMIDLGGLGGTFGVVAGINNSGQVAGTSNLAGDQLYHPFLWDRGVLTDLGTPGGDEAIAVAMSESGDVVGSGWTADYVWQAFLWRKGAMTVLGSLAGYNASEALGVNSTGQVVGYAGIGGTDISTAMLWENGGPMVDLNALVIPASNPSNLNLEYSHSIAESGEIIALGTLPNGDAAIAVLVPDGICGKACQERIATGDAARMAAAGNAAVSSKGAARRPGPFASRRLTLPQSAFPSN
jgi:probable HAF family extracellular repeat protein